jgi:hypothetical protein
MWLKVLAGVLAVIGLGQCCLWVVDWMSRRRWRGREHER